MQNATSLSPKLGLNKKMEGSRGISILGGILTIPERRLSGIGAKRRCPIFVPYHSTAMRSLAGTNLVATVLRRMAELEASNGGHKNTQRSVGTWQIQVSDGVASRMNTDAAHTWLRSTMVKQESKFRLSEG